MIQARVEAARERQRERFRGKGATQAGSALRAATIADLAGVENIAPSHLAEALQYRPRMG